MLKTSPSTLSPHTSLLNGEYSMKDVLIHPDNLHSTMTKDEATKKKEEAAKKKAEADKKAKEAAKKKEEEEKRRREHAMAAAAASATISGF